MLRARRAAAADHARPPAGAPRGDRGAALRRALRPDGRARALLHAPLAGGDARGGAGFEPGRVAREPRDAGGEGRRGEGPDRRLLRRARAERDAGLHRARWWRRCARSASRSPRRPAAAAGTSTPPPRRAGRRGSRARRAGVDVLHHPLPAHRADARRRRSSPSTTSRSCACRSASTRRFRACARGSATAVAARGAAAVIVPVAGDGGRRARAAGASRRRRPARARPGAGAGSRRAARHFLYVGDAEPRKNLDRLRAAYARYAAPRRRGARRSCSRGAAGRPDPDLPELHRHAAALVLPSLHEGFGLTALEAMHAGTPVLAARRPALAEVCGGAARYCDPRDVESIAAGLLELATSPPLREELRRRGTRARGRVLLAGVRRGPRPRL